MLREFARLARCFGVEDLRPLIGMVARAVRMVARSAQPVTDADGLSTRVIWGPTVNDRTKAVGMLHRLARRGPVGRDPADNAPIPLLTAGSSVQISDPNSRRWLGEHPKFTAPSDRGMAGRRLMCHCFSSGTTGRRASTCVSKQTT